jgi:hypothetical protein
MLLKLTWEKNSWSFVSWLIENEFSVINKRVVFASERVKFQSKRTSCNNVHGESTKCPVK